MRASKEMAEMHAFQLYLEAQMWTAIVQNDWSTVKVLLGGGRVSSEIRDETDNTPLLWASTYGHVPIVQLLLSKGANLGAVNKFGHTALMEASGKGKDKVIPFLLLQQQQQQQNGGGVNARKLKTGSTACLLYTSDAADE